MIVLYDIAGRPPIKTWSTNVWKVRYVLNYKKLPYKTIRIEYPDIATVSKSLGIPPSGTSPDGGTPLYTCPAIIDDATGAALSDSYKIAEYLDKQYPDTPKVFPSGTEAFHAAFYTQFSQVIAPLWPLLLPKVPGILNPPSAEYFIRVRSTQYGRPLVEVDPAGEARTEAWARVKANFGEMDGWLNKSSGPFFMGETPTFADFAVAGVLKAFKRFRESNEGWKDVERWHDGRWNNLLENLEQYANDED